MNYQQLLYLSGAAIIFSAGTFALSMEKVEQSNVDASMHVETLVLGSGCFWGAEKRYEALEGVIDAESGYADGKGFEATYRNITKQSRRFDENNYAEVVKVTYLSLIHI